MVIGKQIIYIVTCPQLGYLHLSMHANNLIKVFIIHFCCLFVCLFCVHDCYHFK